MSVQSRKHRGDARGGLRLPPAIDRLRASLVEEGDGCLIKPTNRSQAGYARITVNGRQTLAHRLAWEHYNGPIPNGMVVCHRCDNPPCCNPDHLFLGTIADNNADMRAKGRDMPLSPPSWRKIAPECHPDIRARYEAGESKRQIADDYRVTRQAVHYLLKKWGLA